VGRGLTAAHRIGSALCSTAFAPAHFKGKPEEAAAAILYGAELGFSPTQALRSIFIIGGTPGLYAKQMVALVLAHGHEVWTEEKTDAKVTVKGKRAGSPRHHRDVDDGPRTEGRLHEEPEVRHDPQAMLYARAAADVCRQVAPDALAGSPRPSRSWRSDAATTGTGRSTSTTGSSATPSRRPRN
jgi:hypothetical protein